MLLQASKTCFAISADLAEKLPKSMIRMVAIMSVLTLEMPSRRNNRVPLYIAH